MRLGLDPWVRNILWRRGWQSTPVFLPGESHGQRGLVGYSPGGHKESDTTEQLTHTLKESRKRRSPPLCNSVGWARIPACICCVRSFPAPAGCLSHARSSWTAATVTGRWTTWAAIPPRTETSPTGWWCSWRWPRRGAPRGGKARGAATWAWGLTPTPSINTRGSFFQLHTSYSI